MYFCPFIPFSFHVNIQWVCVYEMNTLCMCCRLSFDLHFIQKNIEWWPFHLFANSYLSRRAHPVSVWFVDEIPSQFDMKMCRVHSIENVGHSSMKKGDAKSIQTNKSGSERINDKDSDLASLEQWFAHKLIKTCSKYTQNPLKVCNIQENLRNKIISQLMNVMSYCIYLYIALFCFVIWEIKNNSFRLFFWECVGGWKQDPNVNYIHKIQISHDVCAQSSE